MSVSRRTFSRTLAGAGITGIAGHGLAFADDDNEGGERENDSAFRHGVASGDPLSNAVIIWTRITPEKRRESVSVRWEVATDTRMKRTVRKGVATATASRDFTVKVDVTGLDPGTTYYYQFQSSEDESAVGRTKTLPTRTVDRLRIGVASCSNLPFGFFNSYRALARRSDLDCVLHLGDYIYEYGNGEYGDGTLTGRIPAPNREILSLSDYRTRYAQYRTDPDLQELHRQHPMIIVWDDHEIANDAYNGGAENHNAGEGSFADRKAAAVRAWNEWQPIRETPIEQTGRIFRTFNFGDLADLVMLDTRNFDRDQQVGASSPSLFDPTRSLLGEEQEAWLYGQLTTSVQSGRRWRLLGQQVMMGQLVASPTTIFNPDQWDGYQASRNRFLTHLQTNAIKNVVVLTGDIHSSWGNDITFNPFNGSYNPATGTGSLCVEFVTPGITSPAFEDPAVAAGLRLQVLAGHPHVKKLDLFNRGYMVLDVTPERVQTEWYHPLTLTSRNPGETFGGALQTLSLSQRLTPASGPLAPKPAPAPAP